MHCKMRASGQCVCLMQVMRIKAATMTWRQWHLNWYHGVGESIFEIYSSACTYLDYCGSTRNSSELTPIFIEKPGADLSWEEALPPAASALKCLYPTQAWWIKDKAIQDKVLAGSFCLVASGCHSSCSSISTLLNRCYVCTQHKIG